MPLVPALPWKACCWKFKITDMATNAPVIDFSKRSAGIEIMDNLDCSGEVVHQTLRELDVINQWLGGNTVTLDALKSVMRALSNQQSLTIADLGCGSGEMLKIIARLAKKQNRKVALTGIDANPSIIAYAQNHARTFPEIVFEATDVLSDSFRERKFDIVIATLFFHHFSTEQLVSLFSGLKKQTREAIIVNDIHRHPLAFYSIRWLTHLFSKSSMVRYDAPLSVLRAFRKQELKEILFKAGIERYSLTWKWAFRWQLIIPCRES